jgi:Abnormal spindle-like microcephaly-assoc'd, ASPM-SPD-2-Hydin
MSDSRYAQFSRREEFYSLLSGDSNRSNQSHFARNFSYFALLLAVAVSLALSGCGGVAVKGAVSSLAATPATVEFGDVNIGASADQVVAISNPGSLPVQVSQLSLTSDSFSINGQGNLPVTIAAGSTLNVKVQYSPNSDTDSAGQLNVIANTPAIVPVWVKLHGRGIKAASGTPTAALSALSCQSSAMTGAGTDVCTVTLTSAAPTGGFSLSLHSSSAAASVPASLTIPSGSSSGSFSATVGAVTSTQAVALSASAGTVTMSFSLLLNAPSAALGVSSPALSFGSVTVNTAATQSVTLTSTGTAPVTINSATASGAGFSASGASFPTTLNPGQSTSLAVQFAPTAAGSVAGQLIFSSNSTASPNTAVSLTGSGTAAPASLTALSCGTASITGSGTDSCTVTLSAAASGSGFSVSLSSNNSAVSVPASVVVPANTSSAAFTATISSVSTAQSATITANAGSATQRFAVQLNAVVPALSVSSPSLSFGSVTLNTTATQSVTLTSIGTAPITINSATASGAGFSASGATFPTTLTPGQSTSLTVQFAPAAAGAVTGQLTISTNSSASPSTVLSLTGTGTAVPASLSALSCGSASMTGSGTDACTVTLSSAASGSGFSVSLSSNNTAVSVPASVVVPANATSAAFTATISSVSTAQSAQLRAASQRDLPCS